VGTVAAVGAGSIGATIIHQFGKWGIRRWRKRGQWGKLPK
jgi:hypothetical protein